MRKAAACQFLEPNSENLAEDFFNGIGSFPSFAALNANDSIVVECAVAAFRLHFDTGPCLRTVTFITTLQKKCCVSIKNGDTFMFDEIFYPTTAAKHRDAPLADQRARYLVHLKASGASRATLRKYANAHFKLVLLLDVYDGDRLCKQDIESAATRWSKPCGRRCNRTATSKARQRFVSHCMELVRHIGLLQETEGKHRPYRAELQAYEDWLRTERGLMEETIDSYCRGAGHFLARLEGMGAKLNALRITDIDHIIGEEHSRGVWSRRSIHHFAQRLRLFIGFAETLGWCRSGLAAGVVAPGYMVEEVIPKGIKRKDVERLFASVHGTRPVDIRDRAILMLLVSYGLRAGEVAGLRVDDLDWENELLRVRCPKPGRTHLWPLSHDAGAAILDYIQNGRPTSFGRSLFFTSCAPIRPLGRKSLGKMVRDRLARIGVVTCRRGPHALRHAAAQHLLDQGTSIKVIGDFLGHRNPSSTAIYAKVNLTALREVAALDLEGLL